LNEIHDKEEEEQLKNNTSESLRLMKCLWSKIFLIAISGADEMVLDGISLNIPANKVTAIVGASGSGKTHANENCY